MKPPFGSLHSEASAIDERIAMWQHNLSLLSSGSAKTRKRLLSLICGGSRAAADIRACAVVRGAAK